MTPGPSSLLPTSVQVGLVVLVLGVLFGRALRHWLETWIVIAFALLFFAAPVLTRHYLHVLGQVLTRAIKKVRLT